MFHRKADFKLQIFYKMIMVKMTNSSKFVFCVEKIKTKKKKHFKKY